MLVYLILIIIGIVCLPTDALAWGPGTHLETATTLLKYTGTFAPVVAALITKYRNEFIYGMVSADILVGKKYAGYLNHCHNWRIGWRVLEACKNDRERASAYGYLAHLAADIVAHNYYIPYMMIKSFGTRLKHHTYWELRFDMHVKSATWDRVREVVRGDYDSFDNLLEETLLRPLFSFKMNKRIFSTILLVQNLKQLRKTVEIHDRFSQWPLSKSEVRHYRYLTMKMARGFLVDPKGAPCLNGDPAGHDRLKFAKNTRKSLRRLKKRKLTSPADKDEYLNLIRKTLRDDMLNPNVKLPESYEAL